MLSLNRVGPSRPDRPLVRTVDAREAGKVDLPVLRFACAGVARGEFSHRGENVVVPRPIAGRSH